MTVGIWKVRAVGVEAMGESHHTQMIFSMCPLQKQTRKAELARNSRVLMIPPRELMV